MQTIILTDAVEAAAAAQYHRATAAHPGSPRWEDCPETDRAVYRTAVRPHVEAAAPLIAAGALQEAATAFATTAPTEAARRGLEYPAVELRAMAYRHTAPRRAASTAPAETVPQAAHPTTGTGARRWTRTALGALRAARTPDAA